MNKQTQFPASEPAQPEHSAKPQDGSLLLEVVEEQQYINQQENHVLPGSSEATKQQPKGKNR